MKKFEAPELEIMEFAVMDVITTSTGSDLGTPELDPNFMGDWA